MGLFVAGLRRVGPSAASILSTLEPVTTVVLAFLVFGEALGPVQLAGGALVLAPVLAVRAPAAGPLEPRPARTARVRARHAVTGGGGRSARVTGGWHAVSFGARRPPPPQGPARAPRRRRSSASARRTPRSAARRA